MHCSDARGGSAANNYLKDLKAGWEWGIDYSGLPEHNPFHRIKKFPVDKKPRYVPSVDDFWAVYDVANRQDQILLQAYLHTAARRGELFRLTWGDVNFSARTINLTARKNEIGEWRNRTIGMSDALYDDLTEQHQQTGEGTFVFLSEKRGAPWVTREKMMPELCEKAGVKPFGFHSIRHLSASLMYHAGEPMTDIQEILGHQSLTTTEKYIKSLVTGTKSVSTLPSKQKKKPTRRAYKKPSSNIVRLHKSSK